MNRKQFQILGLTLALGAVSAAAAPAAVRADEVTEADLAAARASIDDLQTQKNNLLGEIDDLENQLVKTISSLQSTNKRLDQLQLDIASTGKNLLAAQQDRDTQKEAMMKRIRYVYERGGQSGWAKVVLSGGDLSTWLNKSSYTNDLYKYDRQELQNYADTVKKVTSLQQQQNQQKAQMEEQKRSLTEGQARLEKLLSEAKGKYSDYDERIQDAYARAAQYEQIIEAQNEAIQLVAQAQQQAAAAYSESTAEAPQNGTIWQQVAEAAGNDAADTSDEGSGSEGGSWLGNLAASIGSVFGGGDDGEQAQQAGNTETEPAQQQAAGTDAANNAATQQAAGGASNQTLGTVGNGSTAEGEQVLAFAQQYLGGSYVWGGNDLNTGVDCSGFVQQVYKNFGISTSRTSYDMANEGQEVSYNDAQVGDVFVYDGHVGIYAGNGQMINAADEASGITYTPVDYAQIETIRRYL